jgi:hypothetical protein
MVGCIFNSVCFEKKMFIADWTKINFPDSIIDGVTDEELFRSGSGGVAPLCRTATAQQEHAKRDHHLRFEIVSGFLGSCFRVGHHPDSSQETLAGKIAKS